MKSNLGSGDRIIRVMVAIVIAALYFANVISGTVALILLAVAAIFVLTSIMNFCPLYSIFGISTAKKTTKSN